MIRIVPILQFTGPAAVRVRDLKQMIREAMTEEGIYWHDKYLPLHFQTIAYTRYPYAYRKRTRKYEQDKGHRRPMVFTGELMRQATSRAEIRPSPKGVRVAMRGLRAVNLWSGRRRGPNFKEELTAINQQEVTTHARRLDTGVRRRVLTHSRVEIHRAG